MSSTTLDPTVVKKLRNFGRRRLFLLVTRGICAALVTLLLCMSVVAFIDWGWVLTDQMRWCLSCVAYIITIGVVWMTCLSKLVHSPNQKQLATHVEDAEPELRENLLSAVELATDDPSALHDSPVFRGLLQGKVAAQMAKLKVPRLLPVRLLAKWLVAAMILVAGVAFLLSAENPRFRTLAVRAMLPGANVERVSRIQVEILQPTPKSLSIAKDETIAIIVEVSGGDVDEVTLETFSPGEPPQRRSMRGRTSAEFAANVHVDADVIEYRILAGDAVTKRYTISGKDRPRVVAFHKTYQYPEYSGLEDKTVIEDNGDMLVLQGTNTALALELDQDVSAAELRIDIAKSEEVTIVPLTKNEEGRWCTTLPVEEEAIYKVHLVSTETGIENVFSPRHEIRPLPDLIPRAGFVDMQDTNLLLPPNDILALKGVGEDDLPLVSLEQEISVNGREWVAVQLETSTVDDETESSTGTPALQGVRNRITSAWEWDLLGLTLKTGDQVTTRLVATDRKGNRGESVPLRIVVSSSDFDPERHVNMEKKAALYEDFAELATVAEEHRKTAAEIVKRLRDETGKKAAEQRTVEERALDRTNLIDLAGKLSDASAAVLAKVQKTIRQMPVGADAYDLDLAGRAVARLQLEHTSTPAAFLNALQHTDDPNKIQNDLDEVKRAFDRAADDAKNVALHFRQLITFDIAAATTIDFEALLRQQKLIANSPTQTWSRLLRQETVVMNQLRVVEKMLDSQQDRLVGHHQNSLRQTLDWVRQRREQLERATESEDKLKELQQLAQNLVRELNDRQRIDAQDGGLPERLSQARRDFDNRSGTLSEPLSHAATAIKEENRLVAESGEAEDSAKALALTEESQRHVVEVDFKHRRSLDQLRSRRQLTQARADADAQFAADAGLTRRAVTALLNQHRQGDPKESIVPAAFQEIAPAYRILEAGHEMINTQNSLANLIQLERWGSQELPASIDHPRQWDFVQKGLETAVNKLRGAGVHPEIMKRVDEVRWSPAVREANRKISQRRWQRDHVVGAGADLADFRDRLSPVAAELLPVMAEARAIIAKYAPTIPQMAQQAAERIRNLEEQTTEVADTIEEAAQQPDSPASQEAESKLAELQQEQQRINEQIDDLFEALVEDANQQDLLVEEQRERARDADDSIAMVQEPAQRMNEALREAEESANPQEQAQELAEAAEQQELTAQALEKVGEHFDRLEQDLDVAETRAELRQQERDMGIDRQLDERFENAEQLAREAQQNPEDQLAELEAELQRNPAMREALSEISQNAIQEARNALEDAAQQEQDIQRGNEQSDADLQEQKKELTKELKELGQEAAQLARELVAQANSAANQAKTPEAQQKFQQTQQKLNEAANAANAANENQLQSELVERTQQAKQALQEAAETLQAAKEQSAQGKDDPLHADDKSRLKAKKSLEDQRKRFNDQRKKAVEAMVKRRETAEKQKDVQVRNAENNTKKLDQQLQQAKNELKKKPDDAGKQQRVAQAEQRKQQAQQLVDNAKAQQQEAKQQAAEAREDRDRINAAQPALNDKNPAAQLAEAYAGEATQIAEELNRRAEELANAADAAEAAPAESQLAQAAERQEEITENVQRTAEEIARAARHERRLESAIAAAALEQAAKNVEGVANNEATDAQEQLAAAAEAAQPAEGTEPGKPSEQRIQKAMAAGEAVVEAEQAITEQAQALSGVLADAAAAEAAAAAAQAASEEAGESQSGQPEGEGQPQGQQPGAAEPGDPGSPPPGGQQPGQAPPASDANTPQNFTPEAMAEGQQLAQALDELDRQQAAAAAQPPAGQPTPGQQPAQPSQAQLAAQAQRAQMAAERAQAQQQAALASSPSNQPPEGTPAYEGDGGPFVVAAVNRDEGDEWGKLRDKAAEDLTKGRREAVSKEYRKSVETYFRVLAERARRTK